MVRLTMWRGHLAAAVRVRVDRRLGAGLVCCACVADGQIERKRQLESKRGGKERQRMKKDGKECSEMRKVEERRM